MEQFNEEDDEQLRVLLLSETICVEESDSPVMSPPAECVNTVADWNIYTMSGSCGLRVNQVQL